jgi:hypothetical protein
VADEFIEFLKTTFVEEEVDTLARREFSFFVLTFPAFRSTPRLGVGVAAAKFGY